MENVHKKPSGLAVALFVSLVFIGIAGIYIQGRSPEIHQSKQCQLKDKLCVFGDKSIDLSIKFQQNPIVEEELFVEILVSSDAKIHNAWIEGVNMYMGKVPVLFEDPSINSQTQASDGASLGMFFLGSCTQLQMQWVLNVEIKQKNTEVPVRYSVFFDTQS